MSRSYSHDPAPGRAKGACIAAIAPKVSRRRLGAALAALSLAAAPAAEASQASLFSPTTGSISGLQLTNSYNNAIDALNTCNSGASAPANQLSASPSLGNCWINTTAAPYPMQVHDGAGSWLPRGSIDPTNHLWMPPIGGGVGTLASAGTTDLGSVPQAYVNVTGTTTITSFGSSAVKGTMKVLTFAGALTLGYNATSLILPTASNVTTAAGDSLVAVALGSGNWQVVNYQAATGAALAPVPTGTVLTFAGATPPAGFVLCYGQALSRTTYAALFAVIGTTYGAGDGSTTFNPPDFRGYVLAGADNMGGTAANRMTSATRGGGWDGIGLSGGAETQTLTQAQLPVTTPTFTGTLAAWGTNQVVAISTAQSLPVSSGSGINAITSISYATVNTNVTPAGTISSFGSGAAHPQVPPTSTVNYMIKT